MKGRHVIVATVLSALFAVGCGSSSSSSSTSSSASGGSSSSTTTSASSASSCTASIGFSGPITGAAAPVGDEQLAFAKLAVKQDNAANGTKITLVQGDDQLTPSIGVTVAQQFIANSSVLGVVGPAGSNVVEAVGPLYGRAGIPFISGSATNATLTQGKNPTFFRVVSKDSVQGPQDAHYIISHLHPKALMIVDDQEAYSTGLVAAMVPVFKAAGISVDQESVSQKVTDFSSLVTKLTPQTTVVVLPWQIAANAQQFGKNIAEQHKNTVIFGTDGLFSPGTFTINGAYVSSFGPDIRAIPSDTSYVQAATAVFPKFGTFGPPTYAAAHVLDEAISSICKAGQTPSRASVLAAVKKTSESTSILGQPIAFDAHGDLVNGKFFLFKINKSGSYQLIPSS